MDNNPETSSIFDINDIIAAMGLLDAAAEKGAFTGWEDMHKAVHTRLRLQKFAEAIMETTKAAEAAMEAPGDEVDETAPQAVSSDEATAA
jgi:hypothetical protein